MVRKVEIVEAFDHFELVHRFSETLSKLPVTVRFHLKEDYRSEMFEAYSHFNNLSYVSPPRGCSWQKYLESLTDGPDTLWIITTVGRRPRWFYSLRAFSTLFIVLHDVNHGFSHYGGSHWLLGHLFNLRHWLNLSHHRALKKLMRASRGFLYPTERLCTYGHNLNCYSDKFHFVLPFSAQFTLDQEPEALKDTFRAVVPGSIRSSVKDYQLLLHALEIVTRELNRPLEIHFAGPIIDYSTSLQIEATTAQMKGLHSTFYPTGLPYPEYEKLIISSHILISPLRPRANVGGVWETLGQSKISGSFFDAIRYGKRLYVPEWYDPKVKELYRFSSAHDLGEKILQVMAADSLPIVNYSGYDRETVERLWQQVLKQ